MTTDPTAAGRKRILLVASGGGHWVQLLRMRPAFEGHALTFVTVSAAYRNQVQPGDGFRTVLDATRWNKVRLAFQALQMLWTVVTLRPQVVISTGAAPGYFALRFGKWVGARTIWVDSIANVEHLSRSGQLVERHADLWLTQWPELARDGGPRFAGAVL